MKYILSLDGGGGRGVIISTFLARLEIFLSEESGRQIHLSQFFDMFVGTSIGGVLCLGLGSGGMMEHCCEFFSLKNLKRAADKSIWDKILPIQCQPKYDGKGQKDLIDEYIKDIPMNQCPKYTLITTYNLDTNQPIIYKSRKHDINIRDVALMTSAAPIFYPCVKGKDDMWYIDGGLAANNPCMVAYVEAVKTWTRCKYGDEKDEFKILSIGTGHKKIDIEGRDAKDWGLVGWMANNITGIALNAPNQLINNQCQQLLGDKFLRIDSDLGDVSDETDNTDESNFQKSIKLGNRWFEENKCELRKFFGLPKRT